jgi:hypothetical protein
MRLQLCILASTGSFEIAAAVIGRACQKAVIAADAEEVMAPRRTAQAAKYRIILLPCLKKLPLSYYGAAHFERMLCPAAPYDGVDTTGAILSMQEKFVGLAKFFAAVFFGRRRC